MKDLDELLDNVEEPLRALLRAMVVFDPTFLATGEDDAAQQKPVRDALAALSTLRSRTKAVEFEREALVEFVKRWNGGPDASAFCHRKSQTGEKRCAENPYRQGDRTSWCGACLRRQEANDLLSQTPRRRTVTDLEPRGTASARRRCE